MVQSATGLTPNEARKPYHELDVFPHMHMHATNKAEIHRRSSWLERMHSL